ncbi:permease prefix domain 1-containing protein [Micromonospora sp. HM5-17]|uniref:permease prefix domain 1-containing protein n=1 Tax=Micromonospora sp. HM5-17 TaxID=2487710 RepID=UPI000F48E1FC|nr:permease prefix domain 1-containing protein [Micromonospora sp. HM5-17]ROT31981.1 hypothetical protein EF879_10110 [Micromonospora sp. HM5-17]
MPDAIDDYVSAVGAELRGSARVRADMLAEIRAALLDAADSHQQGGLAPAEARKAAVREFGSARRIAAGLQEVLAMIHGRRTALLLLVVLAAQYGAAALVGRLGGWRAFWGAGEPDAGYLWLARATDVFGGLALLAALIPIVLLRHGLRHAWVGPVVVRVTALFTAVVVTLTLTCGVLLAVLPSSAGPMVTLAGVSGAVVPSALVLASAGRSWLVAAGSTDSGIHCGADGILGPKPLPARRVG